MNLNQAADKVSMKPGLAPRGGRGAAAPSVRMYTRGPMGGGARPSTPIINSGYPDVSRDPNMLWFTLPWVPPRILATGTGSIATAC
jgi:hypothetical protein